MCITELLALNSYISLAHPDSIFGRVVNVSLLSFGGSLLLYVLRFHASKQNCHGTSNGAMKSGLLVYFAFTWPTIDLRE